MSGNCRTECGLTRILHEPSCNIRPKGRNAPLPAGLRGSRHRTGPLRRKPRLCGLQERLVPHKSLHRKCILHEREAVRTICRLRRVGQGR